MDNLNTIWKEKSLLQDAQPLNIGTTRNALKLLFIFHK